jgi:acetolactate decarboxylase
MRHLVLLFFTLSLFTCQNDVEQKEIIGIKTVDTNFSKGRLGLEHNITLNDLEKFHGHLCDGLIVGFQGLNEAFKVLYPDGKIDRTNTRIVSNPSPCLTDAAVYLAGGRYQYNTFYVSKNIDGLFVVQRMDTGKAVDVNLNKGVKPDEIDRLGSLAVKGELGGCELDKLKKLEDDFSEFLLKNKPSEIYTIRELKDFEWSPLLQNDFVKTDILNKNKPNCN